MLLIAPQLFDYVHYPVQRVQRRVTPKVHKLEDEDYYYIVFERTCQRPLFENYEFEVRGRQLLVSCQEDDFYKVFDLPDDANLRKDIDLRLVNGSLLVGIHKRKVVRIKVHSYNTFVPFVSHYLPQEEEDQEEQESDNESEIRPAFTQSRDSPQTLGQQPEAVSRPSQQSPSEGSLTASAASSSSDNSAATTPEASRASSRRPSSTLTPADLKKNYKTLERHTSLIPRTFSPTVEDVEDEEFQ